MGKMHQHGHRERLRGRFIKRGAASLEDYELLELLLFNSIPRRDTKERAKRLLYTFGSMTGLLNASRADIEAIYGIGEKTSFLVSSLSKAVNTEPSRKSCPRGRRYERESCGEMLVGYYQKVQSSTILLLSYDNDLNLVGIDKVYELSFNSGAVQPSRFIEAAVRRSASAVAVAFNHPTGPNIPFPSELQTNNMLGRAFSDIGVNFLESYLISGDCYIGCLNSIRAGAVRSKESDVLSDADEGIFFNDAKQSIARESLEALLSFAGGIDPKATADVLFRNFGSVGRMLEASLAEIIRASGNKNVTLLLKLVAEIKSRAYLEALKPGMKYDIQRVKRYTAGIFCGVCREESHILCFDNSNNFIGSQRISEGTINKLEIIPRRIMDIVFDMAASAVVIVHNHPKGAAEPSDEDIKSTGVISQILSNSGIRLISNMIYADTEVIEFPTAILEHRENVNSKPI